MRIITVRTESFIERSLITLTNFTARYAKVAHPHIELSISERIVFATLSTTRADKRTNPATYYVSEWENVAFVGDAFEPAKALCGGEVIDVIRGSQTFEKDSRGNPKFRQTVFEFKLSELNRDKN